MTVRLHRIEAQIAAKADVNISEQLMTRDQPARLITRKSPLCGDALAVFIERPNHQIRSSEITQPSPGRSVVLKIADNLFIRTKGLFGIERDLSGTYVLVSPQPHKAYKDHLEYHLHVDETLLLHARAGRKKFWFSLRAEGAEREFDCQQRLSNMGIGLVPLVALRFRATNGVPLLDGNGDETGAVVFTWPTPMEDLGIGVYTLAAWNNDCSPKTTTASESDCDLAGYCQFLQSIGSVYESVGRTRHLATQGGGIYRHAGHLENFISSPEGRTLMVDTDTCLLDDELTRAEIGAILIRDLSSDVLRMVGTISLLHWNATYLKLLADNEFNPFLRYLLGFFESMLPFPVIRDTASSLLERYVTWLTEFKSNLDTIAPLFAQEWTGSATHRSINGSKWRRMHVFFAPDCMSAIYSLLLQVESEKRRWVLPDCPLDQLYLTWLEGANLFVKQAARLD